MTGATITGEVEEYLQAVRAALADLPADEREDLLDEVEASIADAAAESEGSVAARLGPPEAFAAELKAAAGLHAIEPQPTTAGPRLRDLLRARLRRVTSSTWFERARPVARELAPIWWVARGYTAVALLGMILASGWSERYPVIPTIEGSPGLGALLITGAVLASIALGLRSRRSPVAPRLTTAANVVLALALYPAFIAIDNASYGAYAGYVEEAPTAGLVLNGIPVTNIYPYSREGELLHDVALFDGGGRPLDIPGEQALDPDRRFVVADDGTVLWNLFPIRYYEPGTRTVENPEAAPPVELPDLATPRLDSP